jgi:hypothetical protein
MTPDSPPDFVCVDCGAHVYDMSGVRYSTPRERLLKPEMTR